MTARTQRFSLFLAFALTAITCLAVPPTVGIEGRTEITLDGPLLVPRPLDPKSRVAVRVASSQPDGSGYRYDLRYSGLVPGTYNLSDFLAREGSLATNDLPLIVVTVSRVLPEKHDGTIVGNELGRLSHVFPYRIVMGILVVVWALLLVPLTVVGRKKKKTPPSPPPPEPSLADLLRPLVEKAVEGSMSPDDLSRLEHLLLEHWRRTLGISSADRDTAIAHLRRHPQAGTLLASLEAWLYKPPGRANVDIPALLEPYRSVPSDGFTNGAGS